MADNYSQTSFMVECGSEELARALVAAHEKFEQTESDDWDSEHRTYLRASATGTEVWFTDSDSGFCMTSEWLNFLADWLWHNSLDTAVEITWSETCSKPRIGEFCGGAAVVSRRGWEIQTAYDALTKLAEAVKALPERGEPK